MPDHTMPHMHCNIMQHTKTWLCKTRVFNAASHNDMAWGAPCHRTTLASDLSAARKTIVAGKMTMFIRVNCGTSDPLVGAANS